MNPPPISRPLTEVVEAVAKHQAAGFSPSTMVNSIAPLVGHIKYQGGGDVIGGNPAKFIKKRVLKDESNA